MTAAGKCRGLALWFPGRFRRQAEDGEAGGAAQSMGPFGIKSFEVLRLNGRMLRLIGPVLGPLGIEEFVNKRLFFVQK